jgi:hypothetical protein
MLLKEKGLTKGLGDRCQASARELGLGIQGLASSDVRAPRPEVCMRKRGGAGHFNNKKGLLTVGLNRVQKNSMATSIPAGDPLNSRGQRPRKALRQDATLKGSIPGDAPAVLGYAAGG